MAPLFLNRIPRWLRFLGTSVGLWLIAGCVMVLAIYGDALRQGRHPALLHTLGSYLPYFVPLMVFTWAVALAFARSNERAAGPKGAWRISVPALLLFAPANAAWSALFTSWLQGDPLDHWWRQLSTQNLYSTWTDTMIACGGLAAIAAWSHWRHRQDTEARWQAARADNYRLRLQLLQGQLEPHFLFNALNSVSALVRSGERPVALTALAQVSDLLRYALRASRLPWVSLADELAFVRSYLQVQQLRFGQGLVFDGPADAAELAGAACAPLLLQPLIENAVRHGVEACDGHGTIGLKVSADAGGQQWVVRIDSPLGPSVAAAGHGVGLAATRERLQLLYGSQAGLTAGRQGAQFVVELRFPRKDLPDGLEGPDR